MALVLRVCLGAFVRHWLHQRLNKERPFEIIIPTNPKLASGWGQKLGPWSQIQAPWVPKCAHGPILSPVWPLGPCWAQVDPVGPWGATVSFN